MDRIEGFSDEHGKVLKDKSAELLVIASEVEVPVRQDLVERMKLKYGKIYLDNAVQSFDFAVNAFGRFPSMDLFDYVIFKDYPLDFGCFNISEFISTPNVTTFYSKVVTQGDVENMLAPVDDLVDFNLSFIDENVTVRAPFEYAKLPTNINLHGMALIVQRGNCTVFQKAVAAKQFNASVLIVVNNDNNLETFASGFGAEGSTITEEDVDTLKNLTIITISTRLSPNWRSQKSLQTIHRRHNLSKYR